MRMSNGMAAGMAVPDTTGFGRDPEGKLSALCCLHTLGINSSSGTSNYCTYLRDLDVCSHQFHIENQSFHHEILDFVLILIIVLTCLLLSFFSFRQRQIQSVRLDCGRE